MEMYDPAHPGELIKEGYLKPMGLTVTAAADALGVTRKALSDLLNKHSSVSASMAIRLEKVGWNEADFWLRMQLACNLWEARKHSNNIKINKILSAPILP